MALSFVLFMAALAGLIGYLYFRTGKKRVDGSGENGAFLTYDSDSHCNDSGGDCGGDGGGGD
ncbi:MAG: hypothetical protein K8H84_07640 [Sulfuricella denitrificans]|nr:hypothetical protein [Sulfuricella denitrificans]